MRLGGQESSGGVAFAFEGKVQEEELDFCRAAG